MAELSDTAGAASGVGIPLEMQIGRAGCQTRNVECGLRDESYVEIKHGLEEGDVIVKPRPQSTR